MSQFPSMPLFIDAYLADTTHLTAEEHGAYLLLLMAMWRRGGWVPDDNKDLARMCCVNVRRWPRVKARLMPLLVENGGELSQKKLASVLAELRNRKAQKRSVDQVVDSNEINDKASRANPSPSPYKKIPPNGGNARMRARPPFSKNRDVNDVLDDYATGRIVFNGLFPNIDASVEQRDSPGVENAVQLHAIPKDDGS